LDAGGLDVGEIAQQYQGGDKPLSYSEKESFL
jgi:hypothetical protein